MRSTPRALADLRLAAESRFGAQDYPGLVSLAGGRRKADPAMWPHLWGPSVAITYRLGGQGDGRRVLGRAIGAGFRQPDFLWDLLTAAFGRDPDRADLVARMSAPALPPRLEITAWPTRTVALPGFWIDCTPTGRTFCWSGYHPMASAWETVRHLLC